MQGLYLVDNYKIVSGEKRAIVTAVKREMAGERALVLKTDTGTYVTGTVVLGAAEEVDLPTFDARNTEHGIEGRDRKRWWPDAEKLWITPILSYTASKPYAIELPPGVNMDIDVPAPVVILSRKQLEDGTYLYIYGERE